MGMPGKWISRPKRFADFDERLNVATPQELASIKQDIEAGKLWLDIRDQHGFAPGGMGANDAHIADDWYNRNNKAWWPLDPTEEIRTEGLYQVIKRLEASIQNGVRKEVSSCWLCPGVDHWELALVESEKSITLLVVTPPEGVGSPHRPEYDAYINSVDGESRDAVYVDPLRLKFPASKDQIPGLLESYSKARRVRVGGDKTGTIYRTIESSAGAGDGVVVSLRPAKGDSPGPLHDESLQTFVVKPQQISVVDTPGKDETQNILVISQSDVSSDTDSVAATNVVPGIAVRHHKDDHPDNR